jgi:predicted aconitase
VVAANSIFGARSNFEGGPSALASALLGCTPAYGFHLPENRRANLRVEIKCEPREIADWGAIAAWCGQLAVGYETIPVLRGDYAPPGFNMLKQFGVALASYGGHAMFHLVEATLEAPSVEAACGGVLPRDHHVMTAADLEAVYREHSLPSTEVDLVVFAAPQLGIDEVVEIVKGMDGRRVHENTRLILAIDPQVRAQADNAGLTDSVLALGAEFPTGTCFYGESLAGRILVLTRPKGGIAASWVLAELKERGMAPLGIVFRSAGPVFVQGALLAGLPLVDRLEQDPCTQIRRDDDVLLDPGEGSLDVFR